MRLAAGAIVAWCAAALVGCDGQTTPTPAPRTQAPGPRQVRIAAASDLKYALDELAGSFRDSHPDVAVTITYGSSGNFFAQLCNDAPFDLFLSADVAYPQKLIEQGKASGDTLFRYAVGRIVVWVPADSRLDVRKRGIEVLADESVRKIAIANPKHAPYGRAAEAAMRGAGVYDRVKDKLVLGENIAQAAQFVQSGGADAGVIALSLAVAPAMRDKGQYFEIPAEAHPRIEQGGVVMARAEDPAAAREFRAVMLSGAAKALLKQYGFAEPPG